MLNATVNSNRETYTYPAPLVKCCFRCVVAPPTIYTDTCDVLCSTTHSRTTEILQRTVCRDVESTFPVRGCWMALPRSGRERHNNKNCVHSPYGYHIPYRRPSLVVWLDIDSPPYFRRCVVPPPASLFGVSAYEIILVCIGVVTRPFWYVARRFLE